MRLPYSLAYSRGESQERDERNHHAASDDDNCFFSVCFLAAFKPTVISVVVV